MHQSTNPRSLPVMAEYVGLLDSGVDVHSGCYLAAETHLKLATLSAILMELSESYDAIVHGTGGCLGALFRLGELELVVQEALAAYERQVLRRHVTADGRDVSDWAGLLSLLVEGRVRRTSLLNDVIRHRQKSYTAVSALPEAVKKRELRLQGEDIELCSRRVARDMAKLDLLGRRWVEYKRSYSLSLGRHFLLRRIVRDAIADYELLVK